MSLIGLTEKVGYDVDCSAHTEADQRQSSVLGSGTCTCKSQHRLQNGMRVHSPIVKDVHDKGYEMMLPVNASAVIAVIAHHALRGQVRRCVS